MSEHDPIESEDRIAALLRLAGPRPRPSTEVKARVRAEVHEEWSRSVRRRTRTRFAILGAVAATLAGALFLPRTFQEMPQPPTTPPAIVAAAETVIGAASVHRPDGQQLALAAGEAIVERTWIETEKGATASLEWSGASLRLAEGTRLRLDSSHAATLERGALYFSSGAHGGRVIIGTPLGTVHDIGTQFEVRVADETLRVRVREGRVDLRRGGETTTAAAATELIARNGAPVQKNSVPLSGDLWEWVEATAPPIRFDGLTLADVVGRVAREKGLHVSWRDSIDAKVLLHGDVPFTLDEALDAATASAGVTYRIERGDLVLRKRG